MKVSVVMAPNLHVQPVCICSTYDKAVEVAKKYTDEWNTNTEVWEHYLDDGKYISVHRCLSKTDEESLQKARDILDKYFPEDHMEFEDYKFLEYNILSCPSGLSLVEAQELERLGIEFENGTLSFRFYKHQFNWSDQAKHGRRSNRARAVQVERLGNNRIGKEDCAECGKPIEEGKGVNHMGTSTKHQDCVMSDKECPNCQGEGIIDFPEGHPITEEESMARCTVCNGTGSVPIDYEPCAQYGYDHV